jgi:hypothetical protein
MMRVTSRVRSLVARFKREEQAPAIVVVAMVIVGLILCLFGDNIVGEIGLAFIACAGGVFATLVLGMGKKKR